MSKIANSRYTIKQLIDIRVNHIKSTSANMFRELYSNVMTQEIHVTLDNFTKSMLNLAKVKSNTNVTKRRADKITKAAEDAFKEIKKALTGKALKAFNIEDIGSNATTIHLRISQKNGKFNNIHDWIRRRVQPAKTKLYDKMKKILLQDLDVNKKDLFHLGHTDETSISRKAFNAPLDYIEAMFMGMQTRNTDVRSVIQTIRIEMSNKYSEGKLAGESHITVESGMDNLGKSEAEKKQNSKLIEEVATKAAKELANSIPRNIIAPRQLGTIYKELDKTFEGSKSFTVRLSKLKTAIEQNIKAVEKIKHRVRETTATGGTPQEKAGLNITQKEMDVNLDYLLFELLNPALPAEIESRMSHDWPNGEINPNKPLNVRSGDLARSVLVSRTRNAKPGTLPLSYDLARIPITKRGETARDIYSLYLPSGAPSKLYTKARDISTLIETSIRSLARKLIYRKFDIDEATFPIEFTNDIYNRK